MSERPAVTMNDQVSEVGLLLGAGAAVMNQLAMLGVGEGVTEHSTTLQRPIDRLRTTLTYIFVLGMGTDEEKAAVQRMVNRMHVPVRAEGRYNAFDPRLQLWVAATLTQMGELLHERIFGRLDEVSREHIYRETWIFGTLLQVREEDWPQTRAAFDDYWATSLGELESTPAVRRYAASVIGQEGSPLALRPLMPLQSLLTRGLVPPEVREVLDLPWTPRDQRRFDLFWKVFPSVYRLVPRVLRTLPARLYLRDFRRRMAQGKRVI